MGKLFRSWAHALGLILALACAAPAWAALSVPTVVKNTTGNAGSSTFAFSPDSNIPAGALIFVAVTDTDGDPAGVSSVADNAGNSTYTPGTQVLIATSGDLSLRPFYKQNATAVTTSDTITVTFHTSDAVRKNVLVAYVTGAATTAADIQATPVTTTVGASQFPDVTNGSANSQANDIAFGFIGIPNLGSVAITQPSGYTALATVNASGDALHVAYKITSGIETSRYNPQIATNHHWAVGLWTFKEAAAAAAGGSKLMMMGVGGGQ